MDKPRPQWAMGGEYQCLAEFNANIDNVRARQRSAFKDLYIPRSSQIPISRIPDEILSRIFLFLASEVFFRPGRDGPRCKLSKPYRWMQIIYVCRHWHAVSFATRRLWAFVDLSSSRRTKALLRLSAFAPLTIVHRWGHFCKAALSACIREMGRIQMLSLLEDSTDQALRLPAASPPSPSRLATLNLVNVSSAFAVSLLGPQLTRLCCIDVHLTVRELLAVLRSTPALVDLELSVTFELGSSGNVFDRDRNQDIVSLPALQCLAFASYVREGLLCAAFLEHLKLPPTAATYLVYNSDDDCPPEERPDLSELFRRVAGTWCHDTASFRSCCISQKPLKPTNELRDEEIHLDPSHNLIFVLYPTILSLEELAALPEEPLVPGKLTIMFESPCSLSHDALLQEALASPLLSNISALVLHAPQYSHDTWQRFAPLANVAQLSVSSHALAHSLVTTLAHPAPPGRVLFPGLKTLALRDIRWREGLPAPDRDDSPFSTRCYDALAARRAQGIPLQAAIFGSREDLPGAHVKYLEIAGLVETTEAYVCDDEVEVEVENEPAYWSCWD